MWSLTSRVDWFDIELPCPALAGTAEPGCRAGLGRAVKVWRLLPGLDK